MRFKYLLLLFNFWMLLGSCSLFGQNCEEFQLHIKSIDSSFFSGHILDKPDSTFNANIAFVNYTINNLLIRPSDSCFISDRRILRKLNTIELDTTTVLISDSLINGKFCKISLTVAPFFAAEHIVSANIDSTHIKTIDGQFPFGGQYQIPTMEINKLVIEIDSIKLDIPTSAFSNLYQPNLSYSFRFMRKVEAYESIDGDYIYLYIMGGDAAGVYFSKLVFNHKQFITKIVSDYIPLSIHAGFRKEFIGF